MGGCCSSSKHELSRTSIYTYCPEGSEHRPVPTDGGAVSMLPAGLLMIQNMDPTTPDNYRSPPLPLPFSMSFNSSETLSQGSETSSDKSDPILCETTFKGFNDLKPPLDFKASEVKSKVLNTYPMEEEEEDVCPTCLEEYDAENPRIVAKCQHHFHLSCIFEWMERSDTCPVCDQLMVIDHTFKA